MEKAKQDPYYQWLKYRSSDGRLVELHQNSPRQWIFRIVDEGADWFVGGKDKFKALLLASWKIGMSDGQSRLGTGGGLSGVT